MVAQGKIVHVGVTQARAMVRHKAGKEVEFGLPYLLSRLGGGYVFGTLIRGVVDESKMPLQALAGYRAIFGAHATPALLVYDRGGYATATVRALANEGVKQIGIQPKGQAGMARCRGRPRDRQKRAWQDRRHHWHPEDGQIWVQQAQGTSVADAGDGRSAVYPLVQSEQVDAGSGTSPQVKRKGIRAARTVQTAPIERQEGGQEAAHAPQRSFATRSTY